MDLKHLLGAVALCATMNAAHACSCAPAEPVDRAVRRAWLAADTVVLAEATTIDEVYSINDRRVDRVEFEARFLSPTAQDQDAEAEFNVRQVVRWSVVRSWKGSSRPGTTLETDTRVLCCTCGVKVAVGQRRVLYQRSGAVNSLSTCSVDSIYAVGMQTRTLTRLASPLLH
jgi:hypothetical protein